jgi:iron complex outermembrane receptor protein
MKKVNSFAVTVLATAITQSVLAQNADSDVIASATVAGDATQPLVEEIYVSSRRRQEVAQDVPIALTVVGGDRIDRTGAFNVNRVKELVPSLQLYTSNPRNTAVNIRGLGTTFGLTNDGIDAGVGFYVDGVFYARPAATTMDFLDVERLEVLRGPQGTLFGKNTTSGALNFTTRAPSFETGGSFEVNTGNYGFVQAKGSLTGSLAENVAGRISYSGTRREGFLYNVATQKPVNDLSNQGVRGQLLYTPNEKWRITIAGDYTRQRPDGYAQVFVGVAPTQRPQYRQFEQIIADLNYDFPSRDPFDRVIDHDTPWRSGQDFGGASINADVDVFGGTLTLTSAWRYWDWDPSNDRDFTGLPVLTLSQAPSRQTQWTHEARWTGEFNDSLEGVFGAFVYEQQIRAAPAHTEESGSAQWRFSQNSTNPLWQTPGLLEGYGISTRPDSDGLSAALFGQLEWGLRDDLRLLTGLRYNYDKKEVDYERTTFGGLKTNDPALLALKRAIYSDQAFVADISDTNLSTQLTLAYDINDRVNTYATYSTAFKPIGINVGGLPNDTAGRPIQSAAVIKPEDVAHVEIGLKSEFPGSAVINLALFETSIKDYQTQVNNAQLGVNRGYLASADRVRVRGLELDSRVQVNQQLSLYGVLAWTDGVYVKFTDAPVPLEATGGPASSIDISGERLPGISRFAASLGGEYFRSARLLDTAGEVFGALQGSYRSSFSSSATPSPYLEIDGYPLLNAQFGFRANEGWSASVWARNVLDKNYFELLLPAAGNAGHYAGVVGDPRTYGATLNFAF